MLYEPEAAEFSAILDATPLDIKRKGLYGTIAFEWRSGPHRAVSMRLVLRALGVRLTNKTVAASLKLLAARAISNVSSRAILDRVSLKRRPSLIELEALSDPSCLTVVDNRRSSEQARA